MSVVRSLRTVTPLALVLLHAGVGNAEIEHAHVPGRLIVGFHDSVPSAERQAVHRSMSAELVKPLAYGKFDLVQVDPFESLEARIEAYGGEAAVRRRGAFVRSPPPGVAPEWRAL